MIRDTERKEAVVFQGINVVRVPVYAPQQNGNIQTFIRNKLNLKIWAKVYSSTLDAARRI